MKNLFRVEIIGRHALASFPLRIRAIFIPHAVLAIVIVAASIADFVFEMMALTGF